MTRSKEITSFSAKAGAFFKLRLASFAFLLLAGSLFSCHEEELSDNQAELPDLSFTDQMGNTLTRNDFKGKNIITAFFFTSCPTICPKMVNQMKRVQSGIEDSGKHLILFITIDPVRDTRERLKEFAEKKSIDGKNWRLLTANEESINKMSNYFQVRAGRDKNDEANFVHDGTFIFMNPEGHIYRYDGTSDDGVNKLLDRIAKEN